MEVSVNGLHGVVGPPELTAAVRGPARRAAAVWTTRQVASPISDPGSRSSVIGTVAAVSGDVTVSVATGFVARTLHENRSPTLVSDSASVSVSAPAIGSPLANHRYAYVVPSGKPPGLQVSVPPATAPPAIVAAPFRLGTPVPSNPTGVIGCGVLMITTTPPSR